MIQGNYDCKCDIWAAGVVLHMMLCGCTSIYIFFFLDPPFEGEHKEEVVAKVNEGKIDFDSEEWSTVSESTK
jgi:hypothetical protein